MADGDFVASVSKAADCGILLDLHNIYCNERNGRANLDDFIGHLPLEQVWEVHLAGGMESEGFWLDSHSGPMPRDLAARARQIIRALPNLGALNFEIYDTFLERLNRGVLDEILDELHDIWRDAGRSTGDGDPRMVAPRNERDTGAEPDPGAWEEALTEAVRLARPQLHPFPDDAAAMRLYARLARSFRGSMLLRVLPRGIRYLILREPDQGDDLLARFFDAEPPRLYATLEAGAFRAWVKRECVGDAMFSALLDYDIALLEISANSVPRAVRFPGDPRAVFEALEEGRLPPVPAPPPWEIEILPDPDQVSDFRAIDGGT